MPHLRSRDQKPEQMWKVADRKAQKEGLRNTVYYVNGDQYTGEWHDNLQDGKGTYKWKSGAIYDGDFQGGERCGYGTYSVLLGGVYRKLFTGEWKNDKRHGFGTQYYSDKEYYEGQWEGDKRSGWGRMHYEDGSIFEGEWRDDMRNGEGLLKLPNENRYEGSWKDDKKHGRGKFYFLDSGQLLEGMWENGVQKCGTMRDFNRENAPTQTQYAIPQLQLSQPAAVLAEGQRKYLNAPGDKRGSRLHSPREFTMSVLDETPVYPANDNDR